MLNDKEKKAIEVMKEVKARNVHTFVDELSIVLNLIEKQSKEIEELKEDKYGLEEVQIQAKNLMLCEEALCEIQDKIKAKIEELDKIINTGGIDFNTKSYARCKKVVLQSLLEKE